MGKINYSKEIKESADTLRERYKEINQSWLKDRCEVLIWLKTSHVKTMRAAMELKGFEKQTGVRWWAMYKKGGLDSLLSAKRKGPTSPLDSHSDFTNRLSSEGFSTINEARKWIAKTYGIEYTENGLGNYLRRNKIKLKAGRPQHPDQDE